MKLDAGQVFGASERLQPVTEAPSSVSFITAEEIALYGYRTLADVLRGVRGMYVTDDRNFSLLGTRGFGKPGDYNSRILLLINGHRVNDNIFGQAEIGAEFGLDPATFERVEVIRGPASSLYGDSAFFAVVNVITKSGASMAGGTVALEAGTLGSQLVRATMGHRLANGVDVAMSGTLERSDGVERLYFPAFDTPATNHGIAEGLDGEGVRQFYGHLAFSGLTVTGAYGTRQRDVPTASAGTLFNQQVSHEETTDRHTLLDADYGRSVRGARVTFRASFDRFTYDGTYPFAGGLDDSPPLVGHQGAVGARWSVGTGVTRAFRGRQTVRAGVEFIDNIRQDQTADYIDPPVSLLDSRRYSTQRAAYVQDEIKFARWFIINAGLRYDGYGDFKRATPHAALIVLPSSTQSVKYLYGQAFRAPNAYELNDVFYGEQVHNLRPESIDTHELVWERYVNDWLRTSVSTYWYKADRLITPVLDESAFLGLSFVNEGQVRAKGLELEAQMRLKGASRAFVNYGLQSAVDQDTHSELPNSPRHIVKARLSVSGPMPRSVLSAEAEYMSSRATLAGFRVEPAATVNLTVVQPLGVSWELFGAVRNIFDAQYADPASSGHRQDSIPQNGRTARIGLRWKVWGK
ncbi:MAG: outer rane receptor for ferrienterochelin and colicin [Mycobacterium sp.]|nr:outer rane receptor for ferrienterochelin and colicin [Mycobacterium sp.]